MEHHPIKDIVEAIDRRTRAQSDRLMGILTKPCWPSGHGDRLEPGAIEWVKKWGPTLDSAWQARMHRAAFEDQN
jgi:hypothetical protein